jgi:transcriptional regulator with XRE-family HTH domain
MDVRELVGKNIGRIRRARRLTQEQLAEQTGFNQQYISDLERGKCNPTLVSLDRLSKALGVGLIDLIRDAR